MTSQLFVSPQQHPPKKDYVRAVSLLTGYLIQSTSDNSSTLYYLTQLDPRGESQRRGQNQNISSYPVSTRPVLSVPRLITEVGDEQSVTLCGSKGKVLPLWYRQ